MSAPIDRFFSVGSLFGDESFLLIQPKHGVNAADCQSLIGHFLASRIPQISGILLRDFDIHSDERFADIVRSVTPNLLSYEYASTPRSHVGGRLYTSTEYPSHQQILLHNEMAYCSRWPSTLWFYCHTPSASGGETLVADSHEVYNCIDPEVRDVFNRLGVQYIRNYNTGLDLTWQKAFSTENRAQVENYCREFSIEFEWRANGVLRTKQVCAASVVHECSKKRVWFNQAHLFHISSLPEEVYRVLLENVSLGELPRNSYFGDGSEIPVDMLNHIREIYQQHSRMVKWQRGDVLVVDNLLTAHGRAPYSGSRRVIVAMA